MSFDTYEDKKWAQTGALQDDALFSDNKVSAGFVAERVSYERLNRLFNRVDNLANEAANRGPKPTRDAARAVDAIRGLYTEANSFSFGVSPSNKIDADDPNLQFRHVTPCIIGGDRKVLAHNYQGNGSVLGEVDIFDVATMDFDSTVTGLDSDLPSGDSEEWCSVRSVCDADYAYIVFLNVEATSGTFLDCWLQAFSLLDWTRRANWPTTGVRVGHFLSGYDCSRIIFASADLLAVTDPDTAVSSGTDAGISLVDIADGTVTDSGCGDIAGITGGKVTNLCADGENVYFIADDTTTQRLCSASLADMTSGYGGSGWPVPLDMDDAADVACGGGLICSVNTDTVSHYAKLSTKEVGNLAYLMLAPPEDTIIDDPGLFAVCFDGFNFWARGFTYQAGSVRQALFKINGHRIVAKVGTVYTDNEPQLVTVFGFDLAATHSTDVDALARGNLVSDGRDLWFPGHPEASDDLSGTIFRYPKTNMR